MTELKSSEYTDVERAQRRGFDPSIRTQLYFGSFNLLEAIKSLTETTRSRPVTVLLHNGAQEDDPSHPVVISSARPLWLREEIGDRDEPTWMFDGWILSYGPLPVTRVRIYMTRCDENNEGIEDDMFIWQSFQSREDAESVSWR